MVYRIMTIVFLVLCSKQVQSQEVDTTYINSQIESIKRAAINQKTFEQAEIILDFSQQEKYIEGIRFALVHTGDYYLKVNAHEQALLSYQKLYELGEQEDRKDIVNTAYFGLGKVYDVMGRLEKAAEYFSKSETVSEMIEDEKCLACVYNSIGVLYLRQGNYETAIPYLTKAKSLINPKDEQKITAEININIGIAYVQANQAERSLPYFESHLNLAKQSKDSLEFAPSYGNLAYAYQNVSDFEQAFTYYDSSLYYSNLFQQDETTYITYLDMSDAYNLKQDYQNALTYYKKHHTLKNKVLNEKNRQQINELEVKFETAQKERALIKKQKEVNDLVMARQKMWLLIGGLCASLIIMLLIFLKVKGDNQRKQKLMRVQEELVAIQLKNKELEADQLQKELENKSTDLTNLALDIARKNEFAQQLAKQLEDIQTAKGTNKKDQLNAITKFVKNHLKISEDLALLQSNVDEINASFYEKLEAKFGKLSPNDKYMLGLIRLNLSLKDIASIKNISPTSVKVNRYRLRKKLNLPTDVNFAKYLQDF
ncbi:MAG: tetratricopeptide repeat protein [Bacteroidota bacterium]